MATWTNNNQSSAPSWSNNSENSATWLNYLRHGVPMTMDEDMALQDHTFLTQPFIGDRRPLGDIQFTEFDTITWTNNAQS